jgi:soluble lytic murein transglycosylase-like protein
MLPFQRTARRLMAALALASIAAMCLLPLIAAAAPGDPCLRFAAMTAREAQAVMGPDAPVPLLLGQLRQESSCRPDVTAWDNGRGLAQFMDGTSRQVSAQFPELGPPDPYNPQWAIRALVRYDSWVYKKMKGDDSCQRWGAALKGYNAGPGYSMQAQAKSPTPGVWFGATEYVVTRQSPKNFEYSRLYPRWIILKHQPGYAALGHVVCPRGVAT